MRVQQLRIKLVAFILLETLIIIIVVSLYLSSTNESRSELDVTVKMTRDYIINQPEDEEKEVVEPVKEAAKETRSVNIFKSERDTLDIKGHKCVHLRTVKGSTPICVYSREMDNMISAYITDFHTWEEDWLNSTAEIFLKRSDLVYLDLGCNIGVYTLFVAKLGATVYALDPNIDNLRLLEKSLRLGNLQQNVTLILNAVSDKHESVASEIAKGNIGGSMIKSVDRTKDKPVTNNLVDTVTLNDIGAILKNKKVFIKMDIESYELNAVNGAHNFFQTTDVRYIQMEWTHFRYNEKGKFIIDRLVNHGLFPYSDVHGKEPLHPNNYNAWPENMVWIKR